MIMLGAGLINMFKVSITAVLNAFSAWWHMIGVAVIVVILIVVPDHHQSFGYVFGQTINNTGLGGTTTHGFIYLYVFLTGLLARAVHDHGLRRVGAHERGDAQRVARARPGAW